MMCKFHADLKVRSERILTERNCVIVSTVTSNFPDSVCLILVLNI